MKISRKRQRFSILIASLVIIALLFGIVQKQSLLSVNAASMDDSASEAEAEHFIYIFDDGEKTIVKSSATTVKDVLERVEIKLESSDIVEPSLEENIDGEDFYINIYRSREVVVIDGEAKKYIKTAATEPEAIAKAAGVELLDADEVQISHYNNLLESGMMAAYRVVRAKTININYYGQIIQKRTQAETVGDFLSEQNISRGSDSNWISATDATRIEDGMELSIYHQGKQTVTIEEEIPFETQITNDYSLTYGQEKITTPGQNGKKVVTYEIEMKDGQEISRSFISEIVTQESVTQQLSRGMKVSLPEGSHQDWMAAAGISSSDYGYVNFIISHESGWRPNATNGRYYGLYQTKESTLISACGANYVNDAICQLRSANSYAVNRYGSWAGAYEFWTSHNWW